MRRVVHKAPHRVGSGRSICNPWSEWHTLYVAFRWAKVTCKRCLKRRQRKGAK